MKLITVKQAAALLGVNRMTVLKMLRDGRLRGRKIIKDWRIDMDSIRAGLRKPPGRPRIHVSLDMQTWGRCSFDERLDLPIGATLEDLVIANIDAERGYAY